MKKERNNKKGKLIKTIIILTIVLIVFLIIWNLLQDFIFFHPWNDLVSYKKLQKINEFKEITIKNDEVNLSGWFWNIQNSNKPSPLVIFFPGNGENSSSTIYNYYLSGIMQNVFGKYNLMIIDYPGYGLSKGKPSENNIYLASDYIFEYAKQMNEVDKDNIVIMGYSIGTGVATYCASEHDAKSLILVAPYDKALSLYNDAIDSFHGSITSLAKYRFDSSTFAEEVIEPTLIFTSKDDEVINYRHSLDLAGHFSELVDVIILEGVNHNSYFSRTDVLKGINSFLND